MNELIEKRSRESFLPLANNRINIYKNNRLKKLWLCRALEPHTQSLSCIVSCRGASFAGGSTTSTGDEPPDLRPPLDAPSASDSSLTLISSSESLSYPSRRMSSDAASSAAELGTSALKALFSPPIERSREAPGARVVSGDPGVETPV